MLAKLEAEIGSRSRLSELINGLAYDPDNHIFLLSDKRIGFAFSCHPLSGSPGDEGARLKAGLSIDWPDDTAIQFSLILTENINRICSNYLHMRQAFDESGRFDGPEATHALMKKVTQARSDYLMDRTLHPVDSVSGVKIREQSLIISVTFPVADDFPSTTEFLRATELMAGLQTSFQSVGLAPEPLTNHTYKEIFTSILNKGPKASWRNEPNIRAELDKPLNEQLLDFDKSLHVEKGHLQIGDDCYIKTLSAKKLPDLMWQGDATQYLADILSQRGGLRGNCIISATIYFPAQVAAKDALNRKRSMIIQQAEGPIARFLPAIVKKKKSFDAITEDLDKGAQLIKLNFTMAVFGTDPEDLTQSTSVAQSHLSTLGFTFMEDRFMHLPMLINTLPLCADVDCIKSLFRYKTMSLLQALPLLPIYGDWKGTGNPVAPLISRNGQPISFDLFDSDTNYNATIAAQSGSGKSFFTNYLISSYLSIGAKCWVIDVGLSYLKINEAYSGDFARFDKESNLCLNPFELIEDFAEEEDVIVGLLSAMAAPTVSLDDLQTSGLKEHLSLVWEQHQRNTIIDHIAESLLSDRDDRVKDVGRQLYAFTSKGQYGKFFNGKNNLNFRNPFTVLELEELKGRKHLQQVVLLQLIFQIQQDMYLGERDRRKIVIIDEAWSLLAQGNVGEFIEHAFRRFRKYGGSCVVVTQGVNDLYANAVGSAIAENSAFTLLLGQKAEAINAIQEKKRLPLGDGGYRILKSVGSYKGYYSEIFMITPKGAGIARLTVDPYSILLYSTAPEDVQAITIYTKRGMTQDQAIQQVLRDRGIVSDGSSFSAEGEGTA